MGTVMIFSYCLPWHVAMIVLFFWLCCDLVTDNATPHSYDWEKRTRAPPPGRSLDPFTFLFQSKGKKCFYFHCLSKDVSIGKTLNIQSFHWPAYWLTVKFYCNSFHNTAKKIFTSIFLALLFHCEPLETSQFRRMEEEEENKKKGVYLENPHSIFSAGRNQDGSHNQVGQLTDPKVS